MRDLVKRRPIGNGDQPTNKKMKEEPLDIKPDLRKVKKEPLDIKPDLRKVKKEMEEIEIIGEVKRIPSLSHNNGSFHKYNDDADNGRPIPSTIIDRFMIIPREKVGILIGRKGSNLNELRSRFPSVSIVVDGMNGKGSGMDCPLYLKGTREMTMEVKEVVCDKIGYSSLCPLYMSAPLHYYFKVITVSRSGIYSIDKWRLEKEYCVTMILNEDDDSLSRSIIIHGHQLNVDLATTKVESMMRASGDGMMTWRMCVPHQSVGRIIGKRHVNIIETRKRSGAICELSNAREGEDPSFRYFEVKGTMNQIEIADRMMREFSRQYLDGSFLHDSYDSGFSSTSHSPRSVGSSHPSVDFLPQFRPIANRFYG